MSSDTDVIRFVPGPTDTLLIIFSQRDADGFAFLHVTDHLAVSRLLIRDPSMRGWYNNGLPGLGGGVDEIAASIRVHISEKGYRRVLAMGSSMGGYAALLFGAMLDVESVLAFNPQTVLDRIFPLSPPVDWPVEVGDVLPAMEAHTSTTYNVLIGEEDAVDLWHLAHVASAPRTRGLTSFGSSHSLTEELSRRGELRPLLQGWVDGRPFDGCDSLDNILCPPANTAAMLGGIYNYMSGHFAAAVDDLEKCCQIYPRHPGLQLFFGESCLAVGRYDCAVRALRQTVGLRSYWSNAEKSLRRALNLRASAGHVQTVSDEPPNLSLSSTSPELCSVPEQSIVSSADSPQLPTRDETLSHERRVSRFFRDLVELPANVAQAARSSSDAARSSAAAAESSAKTAAREMTINVAPPVLHVFPPTVTVQAAPPPSAPRDPWDEFFGEHALLRSLGERAMARTAAIVEAEMPDAVILLDRRDFLRFCLGKAPVSGAHCEFGVFSGESINLLADLRPDQTFDGFDSFKGLPREWRGWTTFDFDRKGEPPEVRGNVKLHTGLFEETLPGYAETTDQVAFMHVDCDLYESTQTVLANLGHKLGPDCVIVFDEYFGYPGFEAHERRAFAEFLAASGRQPHWFACCGQRAACVLL